MSKLTNDAQFISTLRVKPKKNWMDVRSELWRLEGFANRSLVSAHGWKTDSYAEKRIGLLAVMEGLSSSFNNHNHLIWLSRTPIESLALEQTLSKFVRQSQIFFRPWLEPVIPSQTAGMVSYMTKENKTCEIDLACPEFPDRIYWPESTVISA